MKTSKLAPILTAATLATTATLTSAPAIAESNNVLRLSPQNGGSETTAPSYRVFEFGAKTSNPYKSLLEKGCWGDKYAVSITMPNPNNPTEEFILAVHCEEFTAPGSTATYYAAHTKQDLPEFLKFNND